MMEDPSYPLASKTPQHHLESNTLPPINGLQMQTPHYNMYANGNNGHSHPGSVPGSMPQTPIASHSQIQQTSSAPPDASAYAQATNQGPPRTLQPPPSYPLQQASASTLQPSGPQHYAPMQQNTLLPRISQNPHLPNLMASGGMAGTTSYGQREPEPTHVVGQQGRRGILPSAAGRPTPNGKMAIPPKNEDGKFPCPHCTKTYLHAKHLKRHMLRHTGDRPYQCKLCKDTFSRSDILKRHFQKCSIRRGHTGDQNHLEGSRNHLKQQTPQGRMPGDLSQGYMNGVTQGSATGYDAGMPAQYMGGIQEYNAQQDQFGNPASQPNSNRSSRAPSMHGMRPDYATSSMPGMQPSMHTYSMPQQPNHPYSFSGQSVTSAADMGDAGQARTVTANGIHQQAFNFASNYQASPAQQQNFMGYAAPSEREVKQEPEMMADNSGSGLYQTQQQMYSSTPSIPSNQVFDGWNLGDPFDAKAAALVAYCFADGLPRTQSELLAMDQLKIILTAANIKRYLQFFRENWNEHWPMIHMPSFSTLDANNGLLLAMMCIGAIYSNEMGLGMERWLMVLIRQAAERSFESLRYTSGQNVEQSMFMWHGTAEHRQTARDDFRVLALLARKCLLTQPIPIGQRGYSMLHQSHQNQANIDLTKWDWQAWTKQEERSRLMLQIYLIDCALAIFFNSPPQLSPNEIQIQLPADDAAWDAANAQDCMNALGMNGDDTQNRSNVTGSRRLSQPEFHLCMQLLFSPQSEFAPRTTNIYSKFLLIHAMHATIWNLQNQSLATQGTAPFGLGALSGAPLSHHDWVSCAGSYTASNPSSGCATPTDTLANANSQQFSALRFALEKWKRAWENDLDIQYPPNGSPSAHFLGASPRRLGFCRDAVHYYWLAKQFLFSPRTFNWNAHSEPEQRMGFVIGVLKQIRTYVAKEGYRLGKELGSVVEIKEDYAVDLTKMNLRDLFVTLPGARS